MFVKVFSVCVCVVSCMDTLWKEVNGGAEIDLWSIMTENAYSANIKTNTKITTNCDYRIL